MGDLLVNSLSNNLKTIRETAKLARILQCIEIEFLCKQAQFMRGMAKSVTSLP